MSGLQQQQQQQQSFITQINPLFTHTHTEFFLLHFLMSTGCQNNHGARESGSQFISEVCKLGTC